MSKTILVVDDDEGITEVMQIVLEGEGYRVQTSRTGDCLHQFHGTSPDLILLDILLIGRDGREVCKALKSNPQTAHIPVIMLSAYSDTGLVADMSGADGYLEKPFDLDTLIETVKNHLTSPAIEPALLSEEVPG
ncbi:MAG TPA: response regulator [Ktedonosporobacter sp.]|nr:response regulator [Ktedonosporobacter sp.]